MQLKKVGCQNLSPKNINIVMVMVMVIIIIDIVIIIITTIMRC